MLDPMYHPDAVSISPAAFIPGGADGRYAFADDGSDLTHQGFLLGPTRHPLLYYAAVSLPNNVRISGLRGVFLNRAKSAATAILRLYHSDTSDRRSIAEITVEAGMLGINTGYARIEPYPWTVVNNMQYVYYLEMEMPAVFWEGAGTGYLSFRGAFVEYVPS